MEISLSGRRYTWSDNHEDPTYELLDRVLLSPSREELYPLVTIMAMNRDLSDHTPLLISICEFAHIPKQFKFENCWLIRSELKVIVSNT
jgi:hypothetical protein